MKFRAHCYLHVGINTVRLTSEAIDTEAMANTVLEKMLAMPGVSGGDLETHVPGIGWVLGGTTEAESAQICARRQEEEVELTNDVWVGNKTHPFAPGMSMNRGT